MGLNHGQDAQAEAGDSVFMRLGQWCLPSLIGCIALLAEAGGEASRVALRYERIPVAEGEYWRLLTGHFVHLGWAHLVMNVVAMLFIWLLVGNRLSARRWLLTGAVIIASIDAGFWWLDTRLVWYVGLSGVLHGLLVAGLVAQWRQAGGETLLLAILLAAKLGYEQVAGPLPGSAASAGGDVVVNAHLYGAIGGLLATALAKIRVARLPSI